MRITGGLYGGRKLFEPKDQKIRPTSDKVRQAIFNSLFSKGWISDMRVLDCFCGTGALALEAISRGAPEAFLADISDVSLALAKKNAQHLNVETQCSFKKMNASNPVLNAQNPYDLIFLDPPYKKGLIEKSVPALLAKNWLSLDSKLVIETEKNYQPVLDGFTVVQEKSYGETAVFLLEGI